MTKTSTPKRNPKKSDTESKRNFAAFKTAVPLVLTLLLLAGVYLFVLLPVSPSVALREAILNSLDREKQTSMRYDGTFGDSNRGIAGNYAGQTASNGNTEFRVQLKDEDDSVSLETINIGETSYVKIDGVENLTPILSKITGAIKPDDRSVSLLQSVQGKWITLSPTIKNVVEQAVPCMNLLPGFGGQTDAPAMDESNYPFKLTAGPYSNDDSENDVYDAILDPNRVATAPEARFTSLVNCLEEKYAKDDFRLRESGPADEATYKFNFTVDPLSNTVKKVTMKSVGMYFQLVVRDYNKDVSISAPDDAVGALDVLKSLTPEQQTLLPGSLGLDLGSVLQ